MEQYRLAVDDVQDASIDEQLHDAVAFVRDAIAGGGCVYVRHAASHVSIPSQAQRGGQQRLEAVGPPQTTPVLTDYCWMGRIDC